MEKDILKYRQGVVQLWDELYNLALYLTKDPVESEDLTQETCERALEHQNSFDPRMSLKKWLFSILRNLFIDYYRKHKSAIQYQHKSNFKGINYISPDSAMQAKEVDRAIDELPGKYKEPIKLRMQGYSYIEISEHLSIPSNTVKQRIRRGRIELKRTIPA